MCKKYSKSIEELVEFINDLSISCSICSTQVFDWICVVSSIRKLVSYLKNL